jgi:three-Cys-motif partner protein
MAPSLRKPSGRCWVKSLSLWFLLGLKACSLFVLMIINDGFRTLFWRASMRDHILESVGFTYDSETWIKHDSTTNMSNRFFEERSEASQVKAQIVDKYFRAWAGIVAPRARGGRIAYIDLFAGPGRYKDGSASVPLMVLQNAIDDPDLRDKLVSVFNDKNENNTRTLEEEIGKLKGIEKLKHKPQVMNNEVGTEIAESFENTGLIPTLFFVDPWGYKGLSLRLINSVLKNWGCDCIVFFNYNRINMGLNNPIVREHMDALFGADRAEELHEEMKDLSPEKRELMIVEKISEALQEMGGKYVLPFCFKNEHGTRTSHYLIFVSKNVTAYTIMKGIMGGESSKYEQTVPSFSYCSADKSMPMLFELARPLDDLKKMLLQGFAGETLTMKEIFERHQVGRPYLSKHYKAVLMTLEKKGKIQAVPAAAERRKNTFADGVTVTFPARGKGS